MSRRGMKGQLNMFDFFSSAESGEVEMVSLVPDFGEPETEVEPEVVTEPEVEAEPEVVTEPEAAVEPEIVAEPEPVDDELPVVEIRQDTGDKVAMSRTYEFEGKRIEIAYINYNKVRITRGNDAPLIKEFNSTKEAVDYYVEQMQELEADE